MTPEELMQLAIEKCREGIALGQTPFGCAIALGDRVVGVAHNTVWQSTDITAHAEMNAIREACQQTKSIFLEGAIVATTCEPCPMCASALHWARVEKIYFGASINDAAQAGFNELPLPAAKVLEAARGTTSLEGNILGDDCRELFQEWQLTAERRAY